MAFDLHIVRSKTRKLPDPVEYEGQKLNVTYKPAVITTEFASDMKQAEDDQDANGMAKGAHLMLTDWDMTNQGDPIEISLELLRQLPLGLLGAIFQAVMNDVSAGESTKKG